MREDLLLNEWEVPRSELVGAVRATIRIKNQRTRTLTNTKCLPFELMLENIRDGAKKVFFCASSTRLPERQNAERVKSHTQDNECVAQIEPPKQREPRKDREPRRKGRKKDMDSTRHKQVLLNISPEPVVVQEECSRHSSSSAETWDRRHPRKQKDQPQADKKDIDTTRHKQIELDILPTLAVPEDSSRHSVATTETWDPSLDSRSMKSHDLGLTQLAVISL
jgi:hypothetical protein